MGDGGRATRGGLRFAVKRDYASRGAGVDSTLPSAGPLTESQMLMRHET